MSLLLLFSTTTYTLVGNGIYVENSTDVVIDRVVTENSPDFGIHLANGVIRALVNGAITSGNTDGGAKLDGSSTALQDVMLSGLVSTEATRLTVAGTVEYTDEADTAADPTVETLFTQTADGTVSNTTSETTLVGSGVGSATLAANYLAAGKTIRITARGHYDTKVSGVGTLTRRVKLGSTEILATIAITPANNQTDRYWSLVCEITCRTAGASGTVIAQGMIIDDSSLGTSMVMLGPETGTTTVDTTGTLAVSITAQYSTADASNTIVCTNLIIEGLN